MKEAAVTRRAIRRLRGSIAALYATGAGQSTPPGIDGSVAAFDRIAEYPVPAQAVRVTVGGRPAEIQYAGAAPHAVAGLLQVNFRVPADAPTGDAVPLVLTVGEGRSPDGVTMAVRSAVQRVLVAEPDARVRGWLKRVLAGAGYDVVVARNGRAAVARARERPIDLVIFSLAIPEAERMDAMQAMLAVRPQPKVVATAGALGPRTLRAADLLGAQAVLRKPLSSKTVVQRVRELLRSRPTPYVVEEEGEGKRARQGADDKDGRPARHNRTGSKNLIEGSNSGIRGQTGLPANFRQTAPEIHGSPVSPRRHLTDHHQDRPGGLSYLYCEFSGAVAEGFDFDAEFAQDGQQAVGVLGSGRTHAMQVALEASARVAGE